MVWVRGGGVFEEVFGEEEVARDPLHWLDQQVVQGQLPRAGLGTLQRETHRKREAGMSN